MAVKLDIEELISQIKADRKYRRLKQTFATHETYRLSASKLSEEIRTCHKSRSVRRLNHTDPDFADHLLEANLYDQAQRSRLIEIVMQCSRAQSSLEGALDSLRHHFLLVHSDTLRSFRTKEERQKVLNLALKSFNHFISEVDSVKQSALLVISDIDKAGYATKNSVEILKLHRVRESNV